MPVEGNLWYSADICEGVQPRPALSVWNLFHAFGARAGDGAGAGAGAGAEHDGVEAAEEDPDA